MQKMIDVGQSNKKQENSVLIVKVCFVFINQDWLGL